MSGTVVVSGQGQRQNKRRPEQTTLRHIAVHELREAVAAGEVIEDYPNDKYGPSCLVLGFTDAGRMG